MSNGQDAMNGFRDDQIQAYHDGELSGFARWRFERELARNPALRAELGELAALGDRLRERDGREPSPDLWAGIALRLPAADARRAEIPPTPRAGLRDLLAGWLKPAGAVAATAAVAWIAVYGGLWPEAPVAGGVVRWIDSGERSVMVLDDDPDTTIIWVLDPSTDGARIGGRRDGV